ncbi:MAG: hypothetical protein IPK84_04165 [Candidatus Moraniibacteriota bacterium]|nr:MAG: hypothetical protein IPK84_04165 [Candidatus Moranbacteria bacterium]
MRSSAHAFTLLEVMLSLAAMAAIAGISVPIYQSFQVRNDLDIAATTIAESYRRATVLAQASDGDASWGVRIQSGGVTLFKGASYAARDASFDEFFPVPTGIVPSGMSEAIFAKFTGMPMATGTVTLTSSANETRTITINTKGMVDY